MAAADRLDSRVCVSRAARRGRNTAGPGAGRRRPHRPAGGSSFRRRSRRAAALAFVSEGDQLVAQARIQASQSATARGDLGAALADAVDARDLRAWAATPYLQIELVAEQQAELVTASQAIAKATDRAPDDWRPWLVRTRIETKRGNVAAGVEALRRARAFSIHGRPSSRTVAEGFGVRSVRGRAGAGSGVVGRCSFGRLTWRS